MEKDEMKFVVELIKLTNSDGGKYQEPNKKSDVTSFGYAEKFLDLMLAKNILPAETPHNDPSQEKITCPIHNEEMNIFEVSHIAGTNVREISYACTMGCVFKKREEL